jgi:hypothetical protein
MADVEALARWMDYAFVLPGGFRFGWAGIIGLIPGIGDLIDALVSVYIVHRAMQLGASRATLGRMALNVGTEAIAGAAPILGDLFDVAFKANRRNYELLRKHMEQPQRQARADRVYIGAVILLAIGAVVLPMWGLVEFIRLITH